MYHPTYFGAPGESPASSRDSDAPAREPIDGNEQPAKGGPEGPVSPLKRLFRKITPKKLKFSSKHEQGDDAEEKAGLLDNAQAQAGFTDASDADDERESPGQNLKPYACEQCDRTYASARRLKRHTRNKHNTKDTVDHNCPHCDSSYERADDLTRHISLEHETNYGKVYACPYCKHATVCSDNLHNHIKAEHPKQAKQHTEGVGDKLILCDVRDCRFKGLYNQYVNHVLAEHPEMGSQLLSAAFEAWDGTSSDTISGDDNDTSGESDEEHEQAEQHIEDGGDKPVKCKVRGCGFKGVNNAYLKHVLDEHAEDMGSLLYSAAMEAWDDISSDTSSSDDTSGENDDEC